MAKRKRRDQRPLRTGNPARRALYQDEQLLNEARGRGITPETLDRARRLAMQENLSVDDVLANTREVSTVVAHTSPDGELLGDQELVGLMHEPDHPERIIGAAPGTPAAGLSLEEVAAKTGYDVDEMMQHVFHDTSVTALRDSDSEVDRAVYQRLRETTLDGMEAAITRLENESATARADAMRVGARTLASFHVKPDGAVAPRPSPSGGKSPAFDLMASMMSGGAQVPTNQAEAEAVMRGQGYEILPPRAEPAEKLASAQAIAQAMLRLDELVGDKALLKRVRTYLPGLGMTDDGRWTGIDGERRMSEEPEAVMELMGVLTEEGATPEITAARRRLADLLRISKTSGEATATIADAAADQYGGAIPHPFEDRPMDGAEARRILAMTLDSYLAHLRPGWGLGAKELRPDDVVMRPNAEGTRVEVSISGTLAEATVSAVTLLGMSEPTEKPRTPEMLAQEALQGLDPRLHVVVVEAPSTPPQGQTSEERARSMACQRQVEHLSSEEDRAAMVLMPWKAVRLSYVGMAHLVATGRIPSVVKPRVAISEEMLREMRSDGWARLGAAYRIQRDGLPTLVRLAFHVSVRPTRQRQSKSTIWVHDVDPRTAEALLGTGPAVPENSALVEGLLSDIPEAYRLGTEDRPRWAGARAFDQVWARAQRTARLAHEAQDRGVTVWDLLAQEHLMTPRMRAAARATVGYSSHTLARLKGAQEVLIDPDQVNMLPAFDSWEEAVRFAADVQLPFEHVFLDLEGPAGSCVTEQLSTTVDGAHLAIRGAYVTRNGPELLVMPYGMLVLADDNDPDRQDTYGVMGEIVFGREIRTGNDLVWAQQVVTDDGFMFSNIAADAAVAATTGEGTNDAMTVVLDGGAEPSGAACYTLLDSDDGTEYDKTNLAVHVAELRAVGLAVLRALFLLTMSNVELVEGGSRQVRRAAQRRDPDALISLMVKVATNRKDYASRGPSDGSRREYSHRFRRRGSVAHYPVGTRMADADPSKVVACGRCGRCRRIFRPATIVGPDDKPLVLKSLKLND